MEDSSQPQKPVHVTSPAVRMQQALSKLCRAQGLSGEAEAKLHHVLSVALHAIDTPAPDPLRHHIQVAHLERDIAQRSQQHGLITHGYAEFVATDREGRAAAVTHVSAREVEQAFLQQGLSEDNTRTMLSMLKRYAEHVERKHAREQSGRGSRGSSF